MVLGNTFGNCMTERFLAFLIKVRKEMPLTMISLRHSQIWY